VRIDLRDLALRLSTRPAVICSREVWPHLAIQIRFISGLTSILGGDLCFYIMQKQRHRLAGPGFAKTSYGLGITGLPRVAQAKRDLLATSGNPKSTVNDANS